MTMPLWRSAFQTSLLILISPLYGASPKLDPHAEAVARIVEGAGGKVEKTEDGRSLKLVDLVVPGAGPHDHRENDPYDAAFFEQLGHITTLESLNVISTKLNDEWIAPIGKLANLKTLKFTNNGKLSDAGMEKIAGLKNLETFSFVGTQITGRAYALCEGWTKVVKVSHRGSSIDDEGLKLLCGHLPNLESISLAHAKFTDTGAAHLASLSKLKGLEIGTRNATSAALKHLTGLPLEYLQLGEGFEGPESVKIIQAIPTLRRLTLTNAKDLTDADLEIVAALKQLDHLELGKIDLPDERLPALQAFSFLKSMRIVPGKTPFTPETQAKIKSLLPKTELQFK
ncbi:MAG: G protein-coupled receptor LGR4 [Prosthecobacter sp.]